LLATAEARTRTRFFEFFAANIRNKKTRRAYAIAARESSRLHRGRQARARAERSVVSHHRRHRHADSDAAAPGQRLCD